jgi:ABC-type microcin C transport system duplicated ATPase subunit YejF
LVEGRQTIEVIERLGLDAVWDVPAHEIGHGQRQALELAMVLALEPSLLIDNERSRDRPDQRPRSPDREPRETAAIARLIELEDAHEQTYFEIGGLLAVMQIEKWFDPCASLDEWVERVLSRERWRASI